jgi:tRNA G10  N-methylase Trm11
MDYLILAAQKHESFRRPELEALAVLSGIALQVVEYDPQVRIPPGKPGVDQIVTVLDRPLGVRPGGTQANQPVDPLRCDF